MHSHTHFQQLRPECMHKVDEQAFDVRAISILRMNPLVQTHTLQCTHTWSVMSMTRPYRMRALASPLSPPVPVVPACRSPRTRLSDVSSLLSSTRCIGASRTLSCHIACWRDVSRHAPYQLATQRQHAVVVASQFGQARHGERLSHARAHTLCEHTMH
jgi:hypothetical protein